MIGSASSRSFRGSPVADYQRRVEVGRLSLSSSLTLDPTTVSPTDAMRFLFQGRGGWGRDANARGKNLTCLGPGETLVRPARLPGRGGIVT
jgi:hypothetical protein